MTYHGEQWEQARMAPASSIRATSRGYRHRLEVCSFRLCLGLALGFGLWLGGSSGARPSGVHAQSREVMIGRFTICPGDPAAERAANGREAAGMLADALTALERGDVMLGRRRLERLIAVHPDSLAAGSARSQLARIYGTEPGAWDPSARGPGVTDAGATNTGAREPGEHQSAGSSGARAPSFEPAASRERDGEAVARLQQASDEQHQMALTRDFQLTAGDRVFFGETGTDLGARARSVLSDQARWLARHAELAVTIEAHADDHGSRESNIQLSQRRGDAVRDRLVEEGVAPGRISVKAFGRDRPVANCPASQCAAQNRRVVTSVGVATRATDTSRQPSGSAFVTEFPVRAPTLVRD